jgi:hypothetical protein
MLFIREGSELENDVARAWWRLTPQTQLPLADGQRCLLLYTGQAGGPAGPDVRDAVLRLLPRSPEEEAQQLVGDVEFHLRASDWFVHEHQHDPRYNRVVLHVVHYLDSSLPTRRADGSVVPTCSLLDLPRPPLDTPAWPCQHTPLTPQASEWPCQRTPLTPQASEWPCQRTPLTPQAMTSTLLSAGLRRFHEKSITLGRALAELAPGTTWNRYDTCLLPALAEGLGYGRDRAFFRAAGLHLMGLGASVPEPLGRAPEPAQLDAARLRILRTLITRWQQAGAWQTLRQVLEQEGDAKATLSALRAAFQPLGQARADILITNCLLPFAATVAALENAVSLASRARHIYLTYPGLASNRVTRMMCTQLQLPAEPEQACLQQGLHAIYTQTCQAKDCQNCLCGGQRLAWNGAVK